MLHASGLVPTRFLLLIAHLVILITVLLSRKENVLACLPLDYNEDQYERKDIELATGLGFAVGLILVELTGFLTGLSMFSPSVMLTSIFAHATATVSLAYFCLDIWDCNLYWWIFGICSAFPALLETGVLIGHLTIKKGL